MQIRILNAHSTSLFKLDICKKTYRMPYFCRSFQKSSSIREFFDDYFESRLRGNGLYPCVVCVLCVCACVAVDKCTTAHKCVCMCVCVEDTCTMAQLGD